jgi:putative endonuclease
MRKMDKKKFGKWAESYAENFLNKHEYKTICRNYHSRYGEIDLIMEKGSILIFVEVKARRSQSFGEPEEAVTPEKKNRIVKTAFEFMASKGENRSFSWRVDLIALKLERKGKHGKLIHYKNILA